MHSTFHFGGALSRVLLTGRETDGKLAVLLHDQPPGNSTPPHRHLTDSEIPVVLSGELTVEADGHVSAITPGTAQWLPSMHTHRLSNRGNGTARFVLICVPSGFERFVEEVGHPARAGDSPQAPQLIDRERMTLAAPRFGIELQPPSALLASSPHAIAVDLPSKVRGPDFAFVPLATTGNDDDATCVVQVTLYSLGTLNLFSTDAQTLVAIDGPVNADMSGITRPLTCGEALHARAPSSLTISSPLYRSIKVLWISTLRAVKRFCDVSRDVEDSITSRRA